MKYLAKFTLATLLGVAFSNLWPALDARAEESSSCYRCTPEQNCVGSPTGFTHCSVMNGKCTLSGSACGISGG